MPGPVAPECWIRGEIDAGLTFNFCSVTSFIGAVVGRTPAGIAGPFDGSFIVMLPHLLLFWKSLACFFNAK